MYESFFLWIKFAQISKKMMTYTPMLLNLNYKFWLSITSKKKTKKKRRKYLYYNFQINIWNIPVSLLQSHETLSLNDSHAHGLPAFSFFVSPRLSVTKILLPAFILEARRLPSIPVEFDVRIFFVLWRSYTIISRPCSIPSSLKQSIRNIW